MQSNLSVTPTVARIAVRHDLPAQSRRESAPKPSRRRARDPQLACFLDDHGRPRELVCQPGADGTLLVVDRDAATRRDSRLLAHLSADEPPENAAVICRHYLRDTRPSGRRCRALREEDLALAPVGGHDDALDAASPGLRLDAQVCDLDGASYALRHVPGRMSIPQLRWCSSAAAQPAEPTPLCLREVVARLESYEPMRTLTIRSLAAHAEDPAVSTAVLRAELVRVQESPIVLNRRLREVVLAALERDELSMSEIAIRCGRTKRDSRGNESGETSWLARRLGLLPDSGSSAPTPWIHIDVLGLIARQGMGLSPREVEV